MRKRIFLALFLALAGIAGVNAQMRIGGSEAPDRSAVLDLNPDNDTVSGKATLGLALPRVKLKNTTDCYPLLSHVKGMSVYNTATTDDVTPGVYISSGVKWLRQLDNNAFFLTAEKDSVTGNEVTDATIGGGLTRSGAGTYASPYTLDIANGGVTTGKLADKSVTFGKLADNVVIEIGNNLAENVYNTVLGDSIINYITQNFSTTALGDSVTYYLTRNMATLELGDTLMQYITNNLDSSALMDSIATLITTNNPYLIALVDNIAQNIYQTTLGDSIVNYISNQISNTLLGDTILQYITENIPNTVLGEGIINLVHENELDGIIGNEITNATYGGGLTRSGVGTAASPYTLGIANSGVTAAHLADNIVNSSKIADGSIQTADLANNAVSTSKINDSAVTSAKIADGSVSNANISSSAAIALNKLALPDAAANNGKVLKSNGTAWVAGEDNNSDTNTIYSAGSGLTLSGTTFSVGTGQVTGSMIADGTIAATDLDNMSASAGQVLKWSGTAWTPTADSGIITETDGVIGNEVTNATANGGLTRSGTGTSASPYTLGISTGGVTTNHIEDNAISSTKINDNAVTTDKIANGTITNTDISASAAIALNKLALPDAATNNGKVLKSNGTTWIAASETGITIEVDGIIGNEVNNATSGGGLTRSGAGTSASPYTLGITTGGVTSSHIANNAVTSAKIVDGTISSLDLSPGSIYPSKLDVEGGDRGFVWMERENNDDMFLVYPSLSGSQITDNTITASDIATGAVTTDEILNATVKAEDLNSMGATEGNVLTFSGSSWLPKPVNLDGAVVYLGTNDETYDPVDAGSYSAGQILPVFIKASVPTGYSYYIYVPYSNANAMFPAFASTIGSGTHSRHIIFTKTASYSSFNVKYLIFGVK